MILFYFLIIFILLYSIILHELAHAKVSDMMGDPTPRMMGRLTLNPIPHLDLFGTLLPIILLISGAPIVFGWAKPVPINTYHYSDQRKSILYVSAAGIVVNFFLAWFFAVIVRFMPAPTSEFMLIIREALKFGVQINLVLAIFNLLPIPPLDGSKIFAAVLPYRYAQYIYRMESFGFFILLFILMFPPTSRLLFSVINFFYKLFMGALF